MSMAYIGIGALIISAGADIYQTTSQSKIAGHQLGLAEDQQFKQDQAWQQLQQLISNPAGFFDSPVYKAAADQGSKATARQNASAFGPHSGNEDAALQQFGQAFGQQQLLSQEQLLAGMSGTQFNPNTAMASSGQSSMNAAAGLSQLGGLLAFFAGSGGGAGGAAAGGGGGGGAGGPG